MLQYLTRTVTVTLIQPIAHYWLRCIRLLRATEPQRLLQSSKAIACSLESLLIW